MSAANALIGVGWGILAAAPLLTRARRHPVRRHSQDLRGARHRQPRLRRGRPRLPGRLAPIVATPFDRRRRREHTRVVERGLPLALDLVTMAARAGYTPRLALTTASRWTPQAVADTFDSVEARCRLGASFAEALDDVGRREPPLRAITDALAVADRSGAPIADLLARLADDARHSLRRRAEAHARRTPVRLLFPLVFLVLPAFGLLTVVPAVVTGLRGS